MFTIVYGYIILTAAASVAITVMGIVLEQHAVPRNPRVGGATPALSKAA